MAKGTYLTTVINHILNCLIHDVTLNRDYLFYHTKYTYGLLRIKTKKNTRKLEKRS